jgi:divalent metal cation (Fe/Co/Zn/Cd) transporter
MEEECFGIPRGGSIVGIIIGLIIVLVGVSLILSTYYPTIPQLPLGAIIVIIIGVLILVGAYYGMRRRG